MKKKSFHLILLFLGVTFIICSFYFFNDASSDRFNGLCLGIGFGTIGLSISNLFTIHWYEKHPDEFRKVEIDVKDERSESIRNQAKAKCADII